MVMNNKNINKSVKKKPSMLVFTHKEFARTEVHTSKGRQQQFPSQENAA